MDLWKVIDPAASSIVQFRYQANRYPGQLEGYQSCCEQYRFFDITSDQTQVKAKTNCMIWRLWE